MKNKRDKWGGISFLFHVTFLLIVCIQIANVFSKEGKVRQIAAVLEPKIDVTPIILNFDEVALNNSKRKTCIIKNIGDSELTIKSIYCTGRGANLFKASHNKLEYKLEPADTMQVHITFTPDSIMYRDVTLNITSNDSDTSNFQIRLKGKGVEPKLITVKPDTINFGNVPVGSTKTESFNIINESNNDFTYAIIFNDSEFFTPAPGYENEGTVFKGDALSFSIQFSPKDEISYLDDLIIEGKAGTFIHLEVVLRGTGTKPKMSLIPDSLDFKQVVKSFSKVDSFSISNTGLAPLKIDSIKSPPDSTFILKEKIQFPLIVEPGSQKAILVIFVPDSLGSIRDSLIIYSNDPKKSIYSYYLKGVGILGPLVHVSPTELNFGNLQINEDKLDKLIIKNIGDKDLILKQIEEPNKTAFKITNIPPPDTVIKKDSAFELIIEFKPTEPKPYNDSLKIFNSSPDSIITVLFTGNGISGKEGVLISSFINYPNPFHFDKGTTIEYSSSQKPNVIANIYDLSGQLVAKLKKENDNTFHWDGLDYYNSRVAYGVYLCELIATAPGKEERRYRKIAITPK